MKRPMKRHLVTMTLEMYGDTPEQVAYIADDTAGWMWDRLGDAGQIADRPRVVSVGAEPLPETEEEGT
jgi:hypothetical protein